MDRVTNHETSITHYLFFFYTLFYILTLNHFIVFFKFSLLNFLLKRFFKFGIWRVYICQMCPMDRGLINVSYVYYTRYKDYIRYIFRTFSFGILIYFNNYSPSLLFNWRRVRGVLRFTLVPMKILITFWILWFFCKIDRTMYLLWIRRTFVSFIIFSYLFGRLMGKVT